MQHYFLCSIYLCVSLWAVSDVVWMLGWITVKGALSHAPAPSTGPEGLLSYVKRARLESLLDEIRGNRKMRTQRNPDVYRSLSGAL